MTILTESVMVDLQTELDIADVWNEVRVMLPSYETTIELKEDGWHRYPVDLAFRANDGLSISRYGRRTKTQSKHVIEQNFAEAYCAGEVSKYKEPVQRLNVKLIGSNDANMVKALTLKVAQQLDYLYAPAGLSAWASIDNLTLDIDLDGIPRLELNLTDNDATVPVVPPVPRHDYFKVGISLVDGTDIVG